MNRIEPTLDPDTSKLLARRSADGLILEGSQQDTREIEVEILGLPNNCVNHDDVAPRFGFSKLSLLTKIFGLTLRQTTSITATITTLITTTIGARVIIINFPKLFAFVYISAREYILENSKP